MESEEDPERVARALVEPMPDLARGPAEEAARFVRVFLEYVPQALEDRMGILWELRTPARCECAVWDGQTVGTRISFSPREFEITGESATKGQLRCKRCDAQYTFEIFSNYAQVARVTTPLPELRTFAAEVAASLGGEVAFQHQDITICAIRIGGHCALTIQQYGIYLLFALPTLGPWRIRTREDWEQLRPTLEKALGAPRPAMSLADVIAAFPREWALRLHGEPVADSATVFGPGQIDLTQNAESVTIMIRVDGKPHTRELSALTDLDGLLPWIEEHGAAQTTASEAARAAFMAKLEREAETPAPELAQVMAVLRDGFPIQVGGGRSFPTYQMKDGQLIVIHSDDGYTEERPCSEATLRAAIADAPNVFADAVRWYGTKH